MRLWQDGAGWEYGDADLLMGGEVYSDTMNLLSKLYMMVFSNNLDSC